MMDARGWGQGKVLQSILRQNVDRRQGSHGRRKELGCNIDCTLLRIPVKVALCNAQANYYTKRIVVQTCNW